MPAPVEMQQMGPTDQEREKAYQRELFGAEIMRAAKVQRGASWEVSLQFKTEEAALRLLPFMVRQAQPRKENALVDRIEIFRREVDGRVERVTEIGISFTQDTVHPANARRLMDRLYALGGWIPNKRTLIFLQYTGVLRRED